MRSRCRCTATPRPPTPRPLRRPQRPAPASEWTTTEPRLRPRGPRRGARARARRRGAVRRARAAPRRAPTRPAPDGATTSRRRFGRYALRLWDGAARASSERERAVSDPAHVRRVRAAAVGRDAARGQRRHGQDVHDRRPRGPLRRRGHAARAPAARDVRPDGDRRAARPRARAAGHAPSAGSAARSPASPPPADDEVLAPARRRLRRRGRPAPPPPRRRPRRLRRGDDRHDPRVLPARPQRASASPATSTPTPRSSRTRPTSSRRWSTTSTCASSARHVPPFDLAEALAHRQARGRQPRRRARAGRAPTRPRSRRCAGASPTAVRRRGRAAQAAPEGPHLRRPADPAGRDAARSDARTGGRARLRERYRVALVDEFQDTDPIQWEIVRTAFGDGDTTLVLIGDPKQAIYAFRGADVYAYLDAAGRAGDAGDARRQLAQRPGARRRLRRPVRRRRGSATPGIEYRTVRAADDHQQPRLRGAPARRRRCACASPPRRRARRPHAAGAGRTTASARRGHRRRSGRRRRRAAVVRRRDRRPATRRGRTVAPSRCGPATSPCSSARNRDAATGPRRPRRRRRAGGDQRRRQRVRHAGRPRLAGPARGARATVVVDARPRRRADARSSAGRPSGSPPPTTRRGRTSTTACTRGRSCCAAAASPRCSRRSPTPRACPARVLGRVRRRARRSPICATSASCSTARRWPSGSGSPPWRRGCGRRIAEARRGRRRRGPQPAAGVRLRGRAGADHPPQQGPRVPDRLLPVPVGRGLDRRRGPARVPRPGGRRPAHDRRRRRGRSRLRRPLAALRRRGARRGAAPRLRGADPGAPPGGRVVGELVRQPAVGARPGCCSPPTTAPTTSSCRPPSEDEVVARLDELAAKAPGTIGVERCTGGDRPPVVAGAARPARARRAHVRPHARQLVAAGVVHRPDRRRPRDATSASEPEDDGDHRRGAAGRSRRRPDAADRRRSRALRAVRCRWRRCPAGARVGSLVHAVLEHVDFTAPDLAGALAAALAEQLGVEPRRRRAGRRRRRRARGGDRDAARSARRRRAGCATSAAADRLDELGFELPLVGGDAPTRQLTLARLADVLDDHAPARRSARRLRATAPRPAARPAAARLPHRQPRRRAARSGRRRHAAVRRRRLQDELARRRRRGR